MAAVVEAPVVEMRTQHPGWGLRTIRTRLVPEGVAPLPGRSSGAVLFLRLAAM
jgi:hypothetical protein